MNRNRISASARNVPRQTVPGLRTGRRHSNNRPITAHRQRGIAGAGDQPAFYAQEVWHESSKRDSTRFVVEPAGPGFFHPITVVEVRERLALLPPAISDKIAFIQFSRMTRKRRLFPCYGMQWGPNVYLYPIEDSLIETYVSPPTPQQIIEARMFGGFWSQEGAEWKLEWTPEALKDFYLNNVLIHEIGHVIDERNSRQEDRERYANWFAIEYGYRASRGRRSVVRAI